MEVKLFEVRDRATFISCFGILMMPTPVRVGKLEVKSTPLEIDAHNAEGFLLRRSGYGFDYPLVLFGRLDGFGEVKCDPYQWGRVARTIPQAHLYVQNNWESLRSGDVIDVEYILGEKPDKKTSERSDVGSVLPLCQTHYPGEDGMTMCTLSVGHPGDHQCVLHTGEVMAQWAR